VSKDRGMLRRSGRSALNFLLDFSLEFSDGWTGEDARRSIVRFSVLRLGLKKITEGHCLAWRSDEKACPEEQQSTRFIGAVPSSNWTFYVVKSVQLV
jgi:hypothetical protein